MCQDRCRAAPTVSDTASSQFQIDGHEKQDGSRNHSGGQLRQSIPAYFPVQPDYGSLAFGWLIH